MAETNRNHSVFIKDLSWYMLGTVIPMGVGFIKTPIFTRYFTPEEYGYLGLISITFSYISVFIYSWLSGCLWRFYNAYKEKNDLKSLYSNLFLIFTGASIVLFTVSLIWFLFADNPVVKHLILLSFIQYFVREMIGLYLIVTRLEGKAIKYNLIHSFRAVMSFALLYIMTYLYHLRITSVITSVIVVDIIVMVFLFKLNKESIRLSIGKISKPILNILFRFGSIGLISNFCFLLVSSSDRYIIALFYDMAAVGIYNQVYNISQLSIVALVTVYFNTINPKLNKELEINFQNADLLISKYLHAFLLLGLPVITWLSLYSKEISYLLLGEDFRSGYTIMPYIFISAFLFGLFMFIEVKFKFADKIKNIAIGVIIASALNIGLNFIFIPKMGYQGAAITTLIAYTFLVFYFYLQDSVGFFRNKVHLKTNFFVILVLICQVAADRIVRSRYEIDLMQTIIEGVLFVMMYLIIFKRKIFSLNIPV